MDPLFKTITKSEKSQLCNPKVYILLVTMLSQIGICVWVGQLQLKSNEIKRFLLDLQNQSHLKRDVNAGQFKNQVAQKLVLGKAQSNEFLFSLPPKCCIQDSPYVSEKRIQEVIVLGPRDELNVKTITFDEAVSVWKVVKKIGSISLRHNTYLEIFVEGFYQVNAQLRLAINATIPEFISYHLKKNNEIVASRTWSSSRSTSSISVVTYANKGDRFSLYNPWKGIDWFVSNKSTSFSAYYIGS